MRALRFCGSRQPVSGHENTAGRVKEIGTLTTLKSLKSLRSLRSLRSPIILAKPAPDYRSRLNSPGVLPVMRLKYCPMNDGFGKLSSIEICWMLKSE